MKLGLIFTGGDTTVRELVTIAEQAEASGFTSLCMAEAWRSGWVPLTAIAAATSTVRLGPYVLNAYGNSPLIAGMAAVDFNEYSGGRLVLGVGGGNRIINEQWQGIPHARVLTKMREYVTLMKRIARTRLGEQLKFECQVHRMSWSPAVDPTADPFPVYLAAIFPRMMRVAAQVADGIAGGATLSAEYLADVVKPQAADAANAVDRDPASIAWTAVPPAKRSAVSMHRCRIPITNTPCASRASARLPMRCWNGCPQAIWKLRSRRSPTNASTGSSSPAHRRSAARVCRRTKGSWTKCCCSMQCPHPNRMRSLGTAR